LTYLLDTNIVIALLRDRPARARERLRHAIADAATVVVSSVVLFELWYGVARSDRRHENAQRHRVFLSGNIGILPFEESDEERRPCHAC
jgi:tRNA(fMet)-specific endonuclease VapC